jgi:hypothetical protein
MNCKMSLQIQPQYVRNYRRMVSLILPPSFVSKHPQAGPNNVLIHHFTTRGIVFSIIHDHDRKMMVFCCAVQISIPPKDREIQIEITSETQMKYFRENLSCRLARLPYRLNNRVMFDYDLQADLLNEIKNDVEVVLLTSNLFMVMFDSTIYFFRIDSEDEVFCFKLPLWKLNQTTYSDTQQRIPDLSSYFDSFRFFTRLVVYNDHVDFDLFSDVVNENSCMCASVRVHFYEDDDTDDDTLETTDDYYTLETTVECSRTLFSRGGDDSPFSSTTEPDFEKIDFSYKTLRIRDEDSKEDSEEEYFDEEDSDEEDSEED